METWECHNCTGHIFIADTIHYNGEKHVIWSHLEDSHCDDPDPIDFNIDRDT